MKYLETLFRLWPRFVALVLLLPLVIGGSIILLFPSYKATANLWVSDPSAYLGRDVNPAGWSQYLTPAQNETDTITQILKTSAFIDALSQRLEQDKVFESDAEERSAMANVENLKVTAVGSHLINLTYTCDRKTLCDKVLTAVITQFQDRLAALQKQQATLTTGFLNAEIKTAQQAQAQAEDGVTRYLAAHPGIRVDLTKPDTSGVTDVDLARLLDQLTQARSHVNELQVQLSQAQYVSDASAQVVKTNADVVDPPRLTKSGLLGDGTSLKYAAVAAAVCVGLAGVYLFVLVRLDRSAREASELESRLSLPVLVTIPRMRRSEQLREVTVAS